MRIFELFGSIFIESDRANQALDGVDGRMSALSKTLGTVGKKITDVGKDFTKFATLPLVGLGTAAVAVGASFSDSMSNVSAVSGATGEDLESLRKLAKELGSTTAHSASAAADAMGYLALAGWDVNQIMAATPDMLSLASAAGMDLANAADIVSDTMSAFQMEATDAGKAADIFAAASAGSNTDVKMLGEAMKYAGAAANAAGMDLAQTSAIMGVLADSGIKGSMAGTTFTAMMRDMKKNALDGTLYVEELGKEFDELSQVSLYNADGSMRDMATILEDLGEATKHMTTEQRDFALGSLFGEQAIKGVNIALATGSERLNSFTEELNNSEGKAKSMAETMEDNLGGSLRSLKSAFEGMLIQISEHLAPIIQNLAGRLAELAAWFGNLTEEQQRIILIIAGVVAAIGPLLIIIGTTITMVGKAIAIFKTLGVVFTFLTGPVGLIILAIAALIAIGVLLYKNWDEVSAFLLKSWEWIKEKAVGIFNWLTEFFKEWGIVILAFLTNPLAGIVMLIIKYWDEIKDYTYKVWEGIKGIFSSMFEWVKDLFSRMGNWTKDKFHEMWEGVKNTTSRAWEGIKSVIKTPIDWIMDQVNKVMGAIDKVKAGAEKIKNIGGAVKDITVGTVNKIGSGIKNTVSKIPGLFEGGTIQEAGRVLVGEEGPELLDLPKGAKVTPLNKEQGATVNNEFKIGQMVVREEADIKKIARELYNLQIAGARG